MVQVLLAKLVCQKFWGMKRGSYNDLAKQFDSTNEFSDIEGMDGSFCFDQKVEDKWSTKSLKFGKVQTQVIMKP